MRNWAPVSVVLIVLATGFYAAPFWPRLPLFDLYQRISPPRRDPAQITIIDIDGPSVRRVGRWPWPRETLAQLVDQCRSARAVGLDILLLDTDPALAASDTRLAAAMAEAPVVLAGTSDETGRAETISVAPVVQSGGDPMRFLPAVAHLAWPLPVLARQARGTGLALVLPEDDGVVRRLPSLFGAGSTLLPSFAFSVLRVAEGQRMFGVRTGPFGVESVSIGARAVPTDPNGAVWPRFARDVPARTIPAAQVLAGEVDPALLAGRIVLVGSSLAGLGDVHLTPLGTVETGTAINAQLIASALAGDTLWRPGMADVGEVLVLAVLGLVSLVVFGRFSLRAHAVLASVAVAGLAATSVAAFFTAGLLLDWTLPALGVAALNLGLGALRVRDDRQAQRRSEASLAAALGEIDAARDVVTRALNSTKLATLGEMASVLAHELRQPIATMSLAAENAEAALQDGKLDLSDARVRIDRIIAQAKRAESMIEHLGIFARAETGRTEIVDVAEAVHDSLALVEPSLRRHRIDLHLDCPPDLPPIRAVKVLLEQVLINLCTNARDALTAADPDQRAITLALRSAGGAVWLDVSDTGPGIAAAAMPHLFEPFFTTKPAGAGVGLGLSVCRRIIESFGGTLTACNGPGGGARFTARLPAAEVSPGSARSGSRSGAPS